MDTKGFRRMLFGEKMPDKNDPKYKDIYERDVNAGRTFARKMRIDKAAAYVQRFANAHRNAFLGIVFGFVAITFTWNVYRIVVVCNRQTSRRSVTEMQDSLLHQRRQLSNHQSIISKQYSNDHQGTQRED